MKLYINDLDSFVVFLSSILKLVDSVKFNVFKDRTEADICNSNRTVRMFFTTTSMTTSDNDFNFSFSDVSKLLKAIKVIKDVEGVDEIDFKYTGAYLSYTGEAKFKFKTISNDSKSVIDFITPKLKTTLNEVYSFVISDKDVKRVMQCYSIVNNEKCHVYFSAVDNKLLAEVDVKTLESINNPNKTPISDSMGLTLCDSYEGSVTKIVGIPMFAFKLFAVFPDDNIKVIFTDRNAFDVRSSFNDEKVKVRIIIPTIKMK